MENSPLYKDSSLDSSSSFERVNAEEWENGRLFKWQERKINQLAEERKIHFRDLRKMMQEWVGRDLVGSLNRRMGMKVIGKLMEIKAPVREVSKPLFVAEERKVERVRVRSY